MADQVLVQRDGRAAVVEGGPPEDPAQDVYVLLEALIVSQEFVGMFVAVVAADAQAAAGAVVEVFDAQHAVVFEGVDFAVDDLRAATVDGQDGAVLDDVGHAVADHVGPQGTFGGDVELFQGVQGEA